MLRFLGKRALVTGAGTGIGRGIAKALVQCGAEVVALSRPQQYLDLLKAEVPSIQTVCMDVTNIEGVRNVIEQLDDIHFLVNNAGIARHEPFLDVKPETFKVSYDVNLKGALFVAQAVARKMVAGGYPGSIVNISSVLATKAVCNRAVYGSGKAALSQLTKVMALELGPHKIRVNAVMPGLVLTNMTRRIYSEEEIKAGMAAIPLGRLPEIEDIVNAVLFLLSDQASMIHGAMLPVDGGYLV